MSGIHLHRALPSDDTLIVTGAAGFIGSFVVRRCLLEGYRVVGVDNLDPYYSPRLKRMRLEELLRHSRFVFVEGDVCDEEFMKSLFRRWSPAGVLHLAAKAGVRASIKDPHAYLRVNAMGLLATIRAMLSCGVKRILLASTSSVYGLNTPPFREDMKCDTPLSPYAASKLAAEHLLHSFTHLYGLESVVLRYFTVYGPWGRPDMSIYRLVWCALARKPFPLFGDGSQERSFTYVEDIAEVSLRAFSGNIPAGKMELYNAGTDQSWTMSEVIEIVAEATGSPPPVERRPADPADMPATRADLTRVRTALHWQPTVDPHEGIRETVKWMKHHWGWLCAIDPFA